MKKIDQLITILAMIAKYPLDSDIMAGVDPRPWIKIEIETEGGACFRYKNDGNLITCVVNDGNGSEGVHFNTFIEILEESI